MPFLFPANIALIRHTKDIILILLAASLLVSCVPGSSKTETSKTATVTVTAVSQTKTIESTKVVPQPPKTSGTSTPVPTVTIPVELSSLKDTQIRIIHPWVGQAGIEFRQLIDEFNQENVWGIKVYETQTGSVSEGARSYGDNLDSSDRLDMVALPPEYLAGWILSGDIIDLSPYIANPEWGMPEKEKTTYLKQIWESNKDGEIQVGIPAQANLQFLVFNKTWADELGYSDPPATQDNLETQLCAAAYANNNDSKKENDGTGGWIINASSATLLAWINSNGNSPADAKKWIDQPAAGEAFIFLRRLMEKGCSWNSRVASPFTYFADRQALAFSATLPDLLELENTLTFAKNTDDWIILPYPGEDKPAPALLTGLSYGITKTDPTKQLASWLFLHWLMLPRNQARLAEADGSIPPTSAAIDLMSGFGQVHPWWNEAQKLAADAHALPISSDWRQIRPVLEDGFWQMLQPTPMPVSTLIYQMGETIKTVP